MTIVASSVLRGEVSKRHNSVNAFPDSDKNHSNLDDSSSIKWSKIIPYLPDILIDTININPERSSPWIESIEGSFILADISGFTAMSERLASAGKEGSEWLTDIVNQYFRVLLDIANDYGGNNVKFGGDALLIFFRGEQNADRAVTTALLMQRTTRRFTMFQTGQHRFRLSMTVCIHSGQFLSVAVGIPEYRMQYIVLGPETNRLAQSEALANPGELIITPETLSSLEDSYTIESRGDIYHVIKSHRKTKIHHKMDKPSINSGYTARQLIAYIPPLIARTLATTDQITKTEGEHRKVAIMFINVVGINKILNDNGAEPLVSELQRYFTTLLQLTERYGGFLVGNDVSIQGIKLLVIFGAPVAHEDDSANALRLALEFTAQINNIGIKLEHKIGINSGFVFAGEVGSAYRRQYTIMGDAVNLAARLMSSASVGQVIASQTTTSEAGSNFIVQELPPILVKGKRDAISIGLVQGECTTESQEIALHSEVLLGRDREIRRFERVCNEVTAGAGKVLSVSGIAGIGKSSLLQEFCNRVISRGWSAYRGTCRYHLTASPFTPWIQVLRAFFEINASDDQERRTDKVITTIDRLRGGLRVGLDEQISLLNNLLDINVPESDLTRSLKEEERRSHLFALILGLFVAAGISPFSVTIEDLQWADTSSLELLKYITTHVHNSHILICISYRSKESFPLELGPEANVRLELSDLPESAAWKLMKQNLGSRQLPEHIAKEILSRLGGNPLFIIETVSVMRESDTLEQILEMPSARLAQEISLEIPDRLQMLIMSRIDSLEDTAKEILRLASVVGDEFDERILEVLLEETKRGYLKSGLSQLVKSNIISAEGTPAIYNFTHGVTHEVIYNSLPFARRRVLHNEVGAYIEEQYEPRLEPHYEELVYHYERGQNTLKTRLYSIRAAEKSSQLFAHVESIKYYQRGLATLTARTTEEAAERSYFHERIGDCYELPGYHDQAVKAFSQARRQWRQAWRQHGSVPPVPTDFDENLPARIRESVLCHKIAVSYERNSDYDSSIRWLEVALRVLPERQPRQAAKIYVSRSVALFRKGLYKEAISLGQKGISLARRSSSHSELAYAYDQLANSYLEIGDLKRAIRYDLLAVSLYNELLDLSGQARVSNNLGTCYQQLGALDMALKHYEIARGFYQRIGNSNLAAFVNNNAGEILITQGHLDEAIKHLQRVVETYEKTGRPLIGAGLAQVNLARAYQKQQHFNKASKVLEQGINLLRKAGARGLLTEAHLQKAELSLDMGEIDSASRSCGQALRRTRELGTKLLEARGLRLLGRVSMIQGQYHYAETRLQESAALAKSIGADYERGLALLTLAKLCSSYSQEKATRYRCKLALKQAIAIFRRMGATIDLSEALYLEKRIKT